MEKSNSYAKEAKKKGLLKSFNVKKEDLKSAGKETLKDVFIGALGGGLLGSTIGRASLLVGALVSGVGNYFKSKVTSSIGVGMMVAGVQPKSGVNGADGKEGMLEGAKDRAMAFKENITHKLWLDKMLKSKKKTKEKKEEVSGTEEVKYLAYNGEGEKLLEGKEKLDLDNLDEIERKVAESGKQYARGDMGMLPSDSSLGDLDPAEKNY